MIEVPTLDASTAKDRAAEFLDMEAAGGIVLMGSAVIALVVAGSPIRAWSGSGSSRDH